MVDTDTTLAAAPSASSYLFTNEWERERARLDGLVAQFDVVTTRHLAALGVGPGWRCLEIGGGTGSIARWLATRVGSAGHVVATDLDIRFLEELRAENIEVRRHDIGTDALEEGAYDLIHARAVLEHLRSRDEIIPRLVQALRPGGTLFLEDVEFCDATAQAVQPFAFPPEIGAFHARICDAVAANYRLVGADPHFGLRLPRALEDAGLAAVDAEITFRMVRGGSDRAAFYLLSAEHLGPRLVGGGFFIGEELARLRVLNQDPTVFWASLGMVSAWGRRSIA